MSPRWRAFERSLRPRVRAAVHAVPSLLQEYERVRNRWGRHRSVPPWLIRWCVVLLLYPMLTAATKPVPLLVVVIWLWVLAAACLRAQQLQTALYAAPALHVFQHLPLSDAQIFRTQWQGFVAKSAWSALDFSMLYAVLVSRDGAGWGGVLTGVALGGVQWLFMLALATCLHRWVPRVVPFLALLLGGGACLLLFFSQPALVGVLHPVARWIPPLGWLPQATSDGIGSGLAGKLPSTVVWVVVLAAFLPAYRRIRGAYALSAAHFEAARGATVMGEAADAPWREFVDQFTEQPAAVEAIIRGRTWLDGMDWKSLGIVERGIGRLLTPRQRMVAEFLVAGHPQWTRELRRMLLLAVPLLVGARVLIGYGVLSPVFLAFFALYLVGAQTVGNWRGFATGVLAGAQPPAYAFHPIGFRDLFVTMLKINLVRQLLMLPMIVLGLFILGGTFRTGLEPSVGWRLLALSFLAQPFLAVAPISTASNDSSRPGFAVLAVAYIIAMAGLGCAFVFLQTPTLVLGAGLVLTALLAGGVMLYARHFNRSRFDLLQSPGSQA